MMRKKILLIILSSGWILLALLLTSGYFYKKLSLNSDDLTFSSITWDNHMDLFSGAIQCNLMEEELLERKVKLKETIFSKVLRKEKSKNGYIFYFEDDANLLASVFEQVTLEKACCPFFKFDISILPNDQGFALQISGSEAAMEMLGDFETSYF